MTRRRGNPLKKLTRPILVVQVQVHLMSHSPSLPTFSRHSSTDSRQFKTKRHESWSLLVFARSRQTRWLLPLLVGLLFVVYLGLSGEASGSGLFFGSKGSGEWSALPRVDRNAAERLRLLEVHLGADEEDPDLLRHPGEGNVGEESRIGEQGTDGGRGGSYSPPAVHSIPEPIKPNRNFPSHANTLREEAVEIDRRICPDQVAQGLPCQFIVAAWLGEQETKAQLHLYQLGLLAMSLNRTLVLPNGASSRFGSCHATPFSFYYAINSLERLGIRTIPYEVFVDWSIARDPFPTAQVVSITGSKATYSLGSIEIDSLSSPSQIPSKPSRNLCLTVPRTRLDFSPFSPLTIFPAVDWHRTESGRTSFGDSILTALSSEEVGRKSSRVGSRVSKRWERPNVLAFNYELRYKILSPAMVVELNPSATRPESFDYFPYAEKWTDLARTISTSLSPFLAIHWRTETLSPGNMIPCSSALIAKLQRIRTEYPAIKTVYLATDYPIELFEEKDGTTKGSNTHSGTFRKVSEEHHKAFKNFLRDFERRLGGLRLTTFSKEYSEMISRSEIGATGFDPSSLDVATSSLIPLAELDSGLIAIIDKTIAIQSSLFLAAFSGGTGSSLSTSPVVDSSIVYSAKAICGKTSSYTTQIIISRKSVLEAEILSATEGGNGEEIFGEGRRKGGLVEGKLSNLVAHWSLKGGLDD